MLAEKFALKAELNPAFKAWFPRVIPSAYHLRAQKLFKEFPTRTERLRSAPIYMYRCLLNNVKR